MEPVKFEGMNVVFAKDQPEYNPLPAHIAEDGHVTSCWKLSLRERIHILLSSKIYISILTFNKPLQPQKLSLENPITGKYD